MILGNILISGILLNLAAASNQDAEPKSKPKRFERRIISVPSASDQVSSSRAPQDGLYAIANVTVHQYPLSAHTTSADTQSPIGEDVSLWVSNIDNKKPNYATEAFCSLTWIASAATLSSPPVTSQMTCVSREPNSSAVSTGLPNYSAQWNVTFQQQAESPVSGFNVIVSSRWVPRLS